MNRNLTITLQIVCITLQSMNVALPSRAQIYVASAIASIQGALGILAHSYNPNGTPAAIPYSTEKKEE